MTTAPETALATRVKSIFATTFAAEGWTVADDKLLRATGKDGDPHAGWYPVIAAERTNQVRELDSTIIVQLYLGFDPDPNEDYVRDPNVIIGYADRFRRAFQSQSSGTTEDLWFLRLTQVAYPPDPTGNSSRFEATVVGYSQNPAAYS